MVRQKLAVGISAFIILFLTFAGVGFIFISGPTNPSPVVQSAQIIGTGGSIVLSLLLVILYSQQKQLLERQINLQASTTKADVHFTGGEFTKEDRLHFTVSNRGGGKATDFRLVVEIKPDIGPKTTFEFDLVRYMGQYKGEPIVESNETGADLYLQTGDYPSSSSAGYNIIFAKLKQRFFEEHRIKITYKIVYDDFVTDDNRVSGFRGSGYINIDEIDPDNLDNSAKYLLRKEFEDNLGEILINHKVYRSVTDDIKRIV